MPTLKGIESSVEFTKHVMTLSGAGIAFVATVDSSSYSCLRRAILSAAVVLLGVALAAGLFVWSRAAVMISEENYNLEDWHLKIPGLINLFSFAFGVAALGAFVLTKIFSTASPPFLE